MYFNRFIKTESNYVSLLFENLVLLTTEHNSTVTCKTRNIYWWFLTLKSHFHHSCLYHRSFVIYSSLKWNISIHLVMQSLTYINCTFLSPKKKRIHNLSNTLYLIIHFICRGRSRNEVHEIARQGQEWRVLIWLDIQWHTNYTSMLNYHQLREV